MLVRVVTAIFDPICICTDERGLFDYYSKDLLTSINEKATRLAAILRLAQQQIDSLPSTAKSGSGYHTSSEQRWVPSPVYFQTINALLEEHEQVELLLEKRIQELTDIYTLVSEQLRCFATTDRRRGDMDIQD